MKTLAIVFGVLIVLFIIIQIYTFKSRSKLESYAFSVIKKYDNFEIRNYEATLFTSVKLETNDFSTAGSKGFSILGGYIFGNNKEKEKIAMTTPVTMILDDSMTVMFMVPKKFTKDNLPIPNESNIEFTEEPAKKVAAISFGGWANSTKISKYKQALISYLEKENISFTNKFYFLGYNPPYDIFGRKNEIIIELK